jgi:hypothetical protein
MAATNVYIIYGQFFIAIERQEVDIFCNINVSAAENDDFQ